MPISPNINKYIESSKINGRLCRWQKPLINVFITPITASISDKNFYYTQVERAVNVWNNTMREIGINIQFCIIQTPQNADIVVHWVKVGRVFEGMCKYVSVINGEIRKISIDIGLFNEYSPKNITNESIFSSILHELGHSLGLGHGVDVDDSMYVPHQKNVQIPSENDKFVLKEIYR